MRGIRHIQLTFIMHSI